MQAVWTSKIIEKSKESNPSLVETTDTKNQDLLRVQTLSLTKKKRK
jgi:hypothetical protein